MTSSKIMLQWQKMCGVALCLPSSKNYRLQQTFLRMAGPLGCRPWLAQLSFGVSALRVVRASSNAQHKATAAENELPVSPSDLPLLSLPSLLVSILLDTGAGPRCALQ